jgi:hypothetical protein
VSFLILLFGLLMVNSVLMTVDMSRCTRCRNRLLSWQSPGRRAPSKMLRLRFSVWWCRWQHRLDITTIINTAERLEEYSVCIFLMY